MAYINKGRNAQNRKPFSHNIYYLRVNWIYSFLPKQGRLNSTYSQLCAVLGDIFGLLSIFITFYICLVLGSALQ